MPTISGVVQAGVADYVFTGTGSPGDSIVVTDNGTQVGGTALVQGNGTWSLALASPVTLTAGSLLQAFSSGLGGPASGTLAVAVAPLATAVPTVSPVPMAGGSTVVTTNAPAGALVQVVDLTAGGTVLGSATAGASGVVAVTLTAPVGAGQQVETLVDGVPNGAPQTTGPNGSAASVQSGTVLAEGSALTVKGTPGAVVQVVDTQGDVLGAATVPSDGLVAVGVSGAKAGETLSLVQNGVAVPLAQPVYALGTRQMFLSTNIFRPLQGGQLQIGFMPPVNDSVTVKVFNLQGERVRLIASQQVQQGQLLQLTWDGRNDGGEWAAAGVYLVSIYGPHTKILKKVIVMK